MTLRDPMRLDIGVIARVPFDEGSLTGTLTKDSTWPRGDWRRSYFVPSEGRRITLTVSTKGIKTIDRDGIEAVVARIRARREKI